MPRPEVDIGTEQALNEFVRERTDAPVRPLSHDDKVRLLLEKYQAESISLDIDDYL